MQKVKTIRREDGLTISGPFHHFDGNKAVIRGTDGRLYAGVEVFPEAMVYIDYRGEPIDREEAEKRWEGGDNTFMVYVGPGFVPLTIVVCADVFSKGEAIEAVEQYLMHYRPDEILDEDGQERDDWLIRVDNITK